MDGVQSDTLCSQQEVEARVEQVAARYEERIIELHSVIAELRKKMERHHINVIRYTTLVVKSWFLKDGIVT